MLRFDLKQMIRYREQMDNFQLRRKRAERFFNHLMPKKLTKHIFLYAFTSEAKAIFAKKALEDAKKSR